MRRSTSPAILRTGFGLTCLLGSTILSTAHAQTLASQTAPSQTAPSQTAPSQTAPSQTGPSQTGPSQTAPDTGTSAGGAATGSTNGRVGAAAAAPAQPEQITVSAMKRRQRVRDVAGSVTVLTGATLKQLGAGGYAQYLTLVPGAVFSEGIPGLSTVSFRGITDTNLLDQGQGTTGYFLNDIPLTEPGFAIAIPDIDTFDVARVEALRGPQSTLFGSATLGGAVDYVANVADPTKWDAAAESSVLGVQGGGFGYDEKAMVNVPIIRDQLAVRAVLDYRQDPGYVDNIGTGQRNANEDLIRDARVSVVWTPVAGTKLTYLFLAQGNKISDQGYSDPFLPLYQKDTAIAEPYYTSTQLHSLRLDQELGFATLTAQAAYIRKDEFLQADDTVYYHGALGNLTPYPDPQTGDSKSQYYEVRLTSHDNQPLTWLVGAAYYQVWKQINDVLGTPGAEQYLANEYGPQLASRLAPDGTNFSQIVGDYDGQEESVFGEASYRLPDHFTFTFGGRLYWTSEKSSVEDSGLYTYEEYGNPLYYIAGSTSDKGFLPKISLRYEPSRNFMAYFLVSEGYRFGQPNDNLVDPNFSTPSGTTSDTLVNYEVGLRTGVADNTLVFEPTLFWIDWSNIQARLLRPDGITYGANAGDAVSRGAEITTTWTPRPVPGLSLVSNITYTDAHLTQNVVVGQGEPDIAQGTQLPTASKWNFSEVLSYTWDSKFHPQASLIHHYISSAPGALDTAFRQGNYNTVDLRLGGAFKTTSLAFFITNLFNSHGVTSGGIYGDLGAEQQYFYVRPRTFGATLDWHL